MNFLSWITCCGSEKVENEEERKQDEEPMILFESPKVEVKNKPTKEHIEVRGEGAIRFCRPPEGTYGKLLITKKVTKFQDKRFHPKVPQRRAASNIEPKVQQHVL